MYLHGREMENPRNGSAGGSAHYGPIRVSPLSSRASYIISSAPAAAASLPTPRRRRRRIPPPRGFRSLVAAMVRSPSPIFSRARVTTSWLLPWIWPRPHWLLPCGGARFWFQVKYSREPTNPTKCKLYCARFSPRFVHLLLFWFHCASLWCVAAAKAMGRDLRVHFKVRAPFLTPVSRDLMICLRYCSVLAYFIVHISVPPLVFM